MTMTPERFQQLLDAGTADAPPAPPVARDLAAGRTRLRRRRTATGVGVAFSVVLVAGGVGLGLRSGQDRAVEPISPTDRAVEKCLSALPKSFFPDARVMAVAQSEHNLLILVESSEDPYWGRCQTPPGRRSGAVSVSTFSAERPTLGGLGQEVGAACPDPVGCDSWAVTFADRVDPAVAEVEVQLWDGSTERSKTHEGYYAFAIAAPLPDGVSFMVGGQLQGGGYDQRIPMIVRVTYLDSDGRPIAASVLDGTGAGPEQNTVEGLPLIQDAYPSLAGGP
jgi:hypothetical protein